MMSLTPNHVDLTLARQTVHAEGIVEMLSPLSHGGTTEGTTRLLRRERFRQPDGGYVAVPTYSGNAFRGQLRDCGVLYMLRRLGLEDQSLSPAAFYFLFSGGTLSKETGAGLDIDRARQIRSIIPLVGVFGAAVGRQILRGKLRMGRGVPVVRETRAFLPSSLQDEAEGSIYDALQVLEFTRTDDAKNERLSGYLPQAQRALLEAPKTAVTASGDEIAIGGAQQMRYGEETLSTGTRLWHEWWLEDATPLEIQAFMSALYVFAQQPFLGGNSRIGHGKVSLRYGGLLRLDMLDLPRHDSALDLNPGTLYGAHLDEHRDEIAAVLGRIPG